MNRLGKESSNIHVRISQTRFSLSTNHARRRNILRSSRAQSARGRTFGGWAGTTTSAPILRPGWPRPIERAPSTWTRTTARGRARSRGAGARPAPTPPTSGARVRARRSASTPRCAATTTRTATAPRTRTLTSATNTISKAAL